MAGRGVAKVHKGYQGRAGTPQRGWVGGRPSLCMRLDETLGLCLASRGSYYYTEIKGGAEGRFCLIVAIVTGGVCQCYCLMCSV